MFKGNPSSPDMTRKLRAAVEKEVQMKGCGEMLKTAFDRQSNELLENYLGDVAK